MFFFPAGWHPSFKLAIPDQIANSGDSHLQWIQGEDIAAIPERRFLAQKIMELCGRFRQTIKLITGGSGQPLSLFTFRPGPIPIRGKTLRSNSRPRDIQHNPTCCWTNHFLHIPSLSGRDVGLPKEWVSESLLLL